jgi:hypothetical protein
MWLQFDKSSMGLHESHCQGGTPWMWLQFDKSSMGLHESHHSAGDMAARAAALSTYLIADLMGRLTVLGDRAIPRPVVGDRMVEAGTRGVLCVVARVDRKSPFPSR